MSKKNQHNRPKFLIKGTKEMAIAELQNAKNIKGTQYEPPMKNEYDPEMKKD